MAPLPPAPPAKAGLRKMYSVPRSKPEVAPDGQSYTTPHFVLRYGAGAAQELGFGTREDQTSFALGKLLQIEALYEFLEDVFGFTLDTPALIVIDKQLKEIYGARPAGYVSPRDAEYGGRTVVHLSVDTISDSAILAHELTHALDNLCVGTSAPMWFAEGLAQMVENELVDARDVRHPTPIGFDAEGRNLLQLWSGHRRTGAGLPMDIRRNAYNHSYYILATLRDQYGDAFYRQLFDLMRPRGSVSDAQLVALMSQAAGEDLEPFFTGELRFRLTAQKAIDDFAPYLTELGFVTDGASTRWSFSPGGAVERHRLQDARGSERLVDAGGYTLAPHATERGTFNAQLQFRRRIRVQYNESTKDWDRLEDGEQTVDAAAVLQRDANGVLIDGVLYRPVTQ
ncbi:hypothetical protein HOK31_09760 [Candidatus Poribacteria bacterium]|nr:hypothetical protein [Candidatus Poribacteria bacterium]